MRFVVPLFVDLLHDDDDLARLYAAEALGDIGAPARSAVPALMEALKRDKCVCDGSMWMKPSWSSTGAIQFAMIEITGASGDPALYNCGYSGSVPMKPSPPPPHPPS
jgi:HEAT repeat protein